MENEQTLFIMTADQILDPEKWRAREDSFYKQFNGQEPVEKFEYRILPHSNSSMLIKGVFPKGTETKETIAEKVKGTFGGRFERFGETSFEYIAYTD